MQKTYKVAFLALALIAVVFLLIGCSNGADRGKDEPVENDNHTAKTEDISLADTYSLETDKIIVRGGGHSFEVTDTAEVQQIIDAIDFSSWEYTGQDQYKGIVYYYLQFGDTADATTIAIYRDISNGFIGYGPPNDRGRLEGEHGFYTMSLNILPTLQEFVKKYNPEMLPQ